MRRKQHAHMRELVEAYQQAELIQKAVTQELITAVLDCGKRAVMIPELGIVVHVGGAAEDPNGYRYIYISEAIPLPTPRRSKDAKRKAEEAAG